MSSPRVERVIDALLGHAGRAVTVLAVELVAALQERNPVDTGWSRANWLTTVGAPASGPVGSREAVAPGAAEAALASLVSTYRIDMGEVHVSNHVPYIRHIGLGIGVPFVGARDGFVEPAIEAAIARAKLVLDSSTARAA